MQELSYKMINEFVSELSDMQNQIVELRRINEELEQKLSEQESAREEYLKVKCSLEEQLTRSGEENRLVYEELEKEMAERKRLEEELQSTKGSLEEQLTRSGEENRRVYEELEKEMAERKRLEEEFQSTKGSLEEQLARREAEFEQLKNLQQQFNSWMSTVVQEQKPS